MRTPDGIPSQRARRGTSTLQQLRKLVDSFGRPGARTGPRARAIQRVAVALGPIAVPTCLRELASDHGDRRAWARALLTAIGHDHRERVLRGVRDVLTGAAGDDAKVDALGLMAELGEPSAPARFADPAAVQRRSMEQLAEHLGGSAGEVAATADLVVRQLPPDELLDLVESMADAAPARAVRLADELLVRVDVDASVRSDVRRIAAPLPRAGAAAADPAPARGGRDDRPALLALLVDDGGRAVVAVCRRGDGPGRFRALSLLIDERGALTDAVYDESCNPERLSARVVEPLLADGYRLTPAALEAVRERVGEAARRAAAGGGLPAAYYLGRDLLALGDAHVAGRALPDAHATLLGRAVDLLATGDAGRAQPLLERCTAACPDDAEAASSLGLCLLTRGNLAGAVRWLEHAARLEPRWPMHAWNLAAVAHRAERMGACYLALCTFVELAVDAPPIARDAQHGHRVDVAQRFIADYERMCRLEGADPRTRASAERPKPLGPRRARRRDPSPRPLGTQA